MKGFLSKTVTIGNVKVPMWALLGIAVLLVIAVITGNRGAKSMKDEAKSIQDEASSMNDEATRLNRQIKQYQDAADRLYSDLAKQTQTNTTSTTQSPYEPLRGYPVQGQQLLEQVQRSLSLPVNPDVFDHAGVRHSVYEGVKKTLETSRLSNLIPMSEAIKKYPQIIEDYRNAGFNLNLYQYYDTARRVAIDEMTKNMFYS